METFGLGNLPHPGLMEDLFSNGGLMRAVDTDRLTRMTYHMEYGIYNYQQPDPSRPLASMAMHPKLNVIEGGFKRTMIRQFAVFGIAELFNISIIEFFEMPYMDAMFILELGESMFKAKAQATSQNLNAMNAELKNL